MHISEHVIPGIIKYRVITKVQVTYVWAYSTLEYGELLQDNWERISNFGFLRGKCSPYFCGNQILHPNCPFKQEIRPSAFFFLPAHLLVLGRIKACFKMALFSAIPVVNDLTRRRMMLKQCQL